MEFLAILLCCGLSAAVIGKLKGSSFVIWFLIGFSLPLLGTLAAVLWRFERDQPHRRCGECGALVPLHDQVCMRCGLDLDLDLPDGGLGGDPA